MNPNDTPETDAVLEADWYRIEEYSAPLSAYKRMTELCRKLERERNANQAMIDKLKTQLTAALDTVAKLEREKQ